MPALPPAWPHRQPKQIEWTSASLSAVTPVHLENRVIELFPIANTWAVLAALAMCVPAD